MITGKQKALGNIIKMINEYFASEKYQEQSEIEEFISNWEKAWESKDINRYKVLLDEDYIYYDKDGTAVDLEDKIKRIKYTFDNYKYIEIDIYENYCNIMHDI